jgi:MFS family permease
MVGLGLALSSQVHTLWQFFITYALIEAIGLSGSIVIGTSVTSRWFTKNRGLALGIVSSGVGLGTLLIVPGTEWLINAFGWSRAFIISGITAGVIMIAAAFLLRPPPQYMPVNVKSATATELDNTTGSKKDMTVGEAIRTPKMILLMLAFCLFFFCVQMISVHLVNYATDMGITPMIAATFVSVIGVVSITGRLSTGIGADKIGMHNTLILTRVFLVLSFICLIFTKSLWMFYLFAVIFGFTYGGEAPQIPLFISEYFGTKSMATLVGLTLFIGMIGASLGPWVAGKIFDTTQSYEWAFIIGAVAGLVSLVLALVLKRQSRETQ